MKDWLPFIMFAAVAFLVAVLRVYEVTHERREAKKFADRMRGVGGVGGVGGDWVDVAAMRRYLERI
jgi:hypothetical protein